MSSSSSPSSLLASLSVSASLVPSASATPTAEALVGSSMIPWNARTAFDRISSDSHFNFCKRYITSELLAGVVFEGAFYSRARSIPFSLSVTQFFSKHKKPWTISLHNHTILIHHNQNYFIQHTNVRFIY